jgi:flavin-dependent dehydrogenase
MEERFEKSCDVLIIGAGMAGGLLARQLSIEQPDLHLIVVDAKTSFDWWVGESTVEVFDDYATRVCRLGPYLAAKHITKHGLRFFFDSAAKDLPLVELSEQGRSRYTTLNRGSQIDRATFDRDLCEINRQDGVEVLLGVRVLDRKNSAGEPPIRIDPEGGHRVRTTAGTIHCRYLVDAGGRSAPLARLLDLVPTGKAERSAMFSYWGRFEGCRSIDDVGNDEWRRRVEYTMRWASTNHFMYDGYWIWLIPVSDRIVSLGVTFDRRLVPTSMKNGDDLVSFLRRHRALDEIMGPDARLLDFVGLSHINRGAKQYFSSDRWYLTGMSGFFVDALFSNSSAVIAQGNRMIAALIAADRAGDQVRLARRLKHFNIALRNIYLRQLQAFDKYHALGSFDAFVNWQTLRYHSILNYDVPLQHADYRPMIEKIDQHDDHCGCGVGVANENQQLGIAGDRLTEEFVAFIDERGQYHARNRGYFHDKTERAATRQKTVDLDFGDAVRAESLLNWEAFVRYYIGRMCEIEGIPFDEDCFVAVFQPDWAAGQTLHEVFDMIRKHAAEGKPAKPPAVRWDLKGPIDPEIERESPWWCRFVGPSGEAVR